MNALSLVTLLTVSFTFSAHAQLATQAPLAHERVNNSISIGCEYLNDSPTYKANKLSEEFIKNKYVKVHFVANQTEFAIKVDRENNATLSSKDASEKISAQIKSEKYRGYKVKMLNFASSHSSFAQKINIKNLKCWMETAVEKYHALTQPEVHINVHPYFNYDYSGATKTIVEEKLSDPSKQQVVLLDDTYMKASLADPGMFIQNGGSYLRNRNLSIIDLKLPKETAVLVSPSGHNEYIITEPETTITYTGGNHNYCMLSNTAHMIEAFIKSPSTQSLNLDYITDAIVVQKKTFAQGLSIPRSIIRKSNVLGTMFQDSTFARDYHQAYFNYFAHNRILWFTNFFKTVTFEYQSKTFNQSISIKGNGEKDFTIRMNFL